MSTNESADVEPDDDAGDGSGDGVVDSYPTDGEIQDAYQFFQGIKRAYQIEDDDLLAVLFSLQVRLSRVEEAQSNLLTETRRQRDPSIVGEFPVEMSHSVPADTPITDPNLVERTPDEDGFARVTAISVGWQDGAGNAVGIQVRTANGLKLLPRNPEDQYLAFNDFSETFPLRYTLSPGETLVAQTVNLDNQNSHFVNIVPHVREVREELGEKQREWQEDRQTIGGSG